MAVPTGTAGLLPTGRRCRPRQLARRVHDELRHHLAPAANRTETFVTVVIPERRLRRAARSSPGALGGRSEVLTGMMTEVGALLTGPLGAHRVEWLGAEDLAAACRSAFQPPCAGGPAVSAEQDHERGWGWADVGVARAETQPRWYAHGGYRSVSSALLLPARGAALGSLGPVLSGGAVGEARSLLVGFPVLPPDLAERRTASREWAADLGDGLRDRARIRPRAQARADNAAARAVDAKLVRGASLCRPYAVATVTVSADAVERGRRPPARRIHPAGRVHRSAARPRP